MMNFETAVERDLFMYLSEVRDIVKDDKRFSDLEAIEGWLKHIVERLSR